MAEFGGGSDAFNILLTGNWGNQVDITPIGFNIKRVKGSFEFTTSSSSGTSGQSSSGNNVPEPGVLALFECGFVGSGIANTSAPSSAKIVLI